MCGIFGTRAKYGINKTIKGLKLLEYRGYDSAGVAIRRQDAIEIVKTQGRVDALNQKLTDTPESDNCIGHTRWATHGGVTDQNAHPFLSADKRFAVVHNGIIENYKELKSELENEGVQFSSDTDSETVAHLLNKYYIQYGQVLAAVLATVNRLKGSFALLVCNTVDDSLYAAKYLSPLCIGYNHECQYICSDISTLRHFVSTVGFVENNTVVECSNDGFKFFDFEGNCKTCRIFNLPMLESHNEQTKSHMYSEILEIPKRLKQTFENITQHGLPIPLRIAKKIKRIYLVGCGTAFHSGLATAEIFRKFVGVDVFCVLASEIMYSNYILDSNCLVVAISQSGETADTLAACEFAKSKKAHTLAITNVASSSISFVADWVEYVSAGQEIAVASTKAYNCQLIALILLACDLGVACGKVTQSQRQRLKEAFAELPHAVDKVLAMSTEIQNIVERLIDTTAVFYLGRTADLATASEGSLKLKEISYIHSEAYASGELKHGTLALIEQGVTVVVIACNSQLKKKYETVVSEVLSRGADVLVVTPFDLDISPSNKVKICTLPAVYEVFYPVLSVVPLQLLAFYFSQLKGCDTDKPRNLAKSVTVD